MKKILLKTMLAASILMATSRSSFGQHPQAHSSSLEETEFAKISPHPDPEMQALYNEVRKDMGLPEDTLMIAPDTHESDMGDLYTLNRYNPAQKDSLDFKVVMTKNFEKFLPKQDLKTFLAHENGHYLWHILEKEASGKNAKEYYGRDSVAMKDLRRSEDFSDSIAVATYGYEKFVTAFGHLTTKNLYLYRQSLRRFIEKSPEFCRLTGTAEESTVRIDWDKFPKNPREYDEQTEEIFAWAELISSAKRVYEKSDEMSLSSLVVSAQLLTDFNTTHPAGPSVRRLENAKNWNASIAKQQHRAFKDRFDNGNTRQDQHRR